MAHSRHSVSLFADRPLFLCEQPDAVMCGAVVTGQMALPDPLAFLYNDSMTTAEKPTRAISSA